MVETGQNTRDEIFSQPQAWAEAIEIVEAQKDKIENIRISSYDQALFMGCGSTYYLSLSAAKFMQSLAGVICKGVPSSEMFMFPNECLGAMKRTLLCAISRSGTTTETLQAVEDFTSSGSGQLITITTNPDSPLAKSGDINLIIPGGFEKSVAQTKSFSSMFLAALSLAIHAGKRRDFASLLRRLIPIGETLLNGNQDLMQQLGEDGAISQCFFLGSGVNYGLACEASLKLKEMSLTVTEPYHFMEFRHGPISMVDEHTLVVGLLSDDKIKYEAPVLEQVRKIGAKVLTLGEKSADISFNSDLPEPVRKVLYLPPLQLMAYYRSMHFGLDPDHPRNLTAVVNLKMPGRSG